MRSIIAEHPEGALSVWPAPDERRPQFADRDARLKTLGPEGLRLALAFLIGFHPARIRRGPGRGRPLRRRR